MEALPCIPINTDVVHEIQDARYAGREVFLATAAHRAIAEHYKKTTGLFTEFFASSGGENLKGSAKACVLSTKFGEKGFDYIGDCSADIPVWGKARRALTVNSSPRLLRKIHKINSKISIVSHDKPRLADYIKALRIHQWAKNILVFLPLILSHSFIESSFVMALVAFFSFSFCASAVYIINDLFDLTADRSHPSKRHRPFAAGRISLWQTPLILGILTALSFGLCLFLPTGFSKILFCYFFMTLAYSFLCKKIMMLDVTTLTILYFLRIAAGACAVQVEISNWIVGFSIFLFLGLALIKRTSELASSEAVHNDKIQGRGYFVGDMSVLQSMSAISGFCSITILTLYIDSMQAINLYTYPQRLWGILPLMIYWYGRVLLLTGRKQMDEDPIKFVLQDLVSILCFFIGTIVFFSAI